REVGGLRRAPARARRRLQAAARRRAWLMPGFLRVLGVAILVLGLATAGVASWLVAGDAHFREVAAAYARHPEHALFQTEYWVAAARPPERDRPARPLFHHILLPRRGALASSRRPGGRRRIHPSPVYNPGS